MINFEQYLYEKVKSAIDTWDEPKIYAISFFVNSNEANKYKEFSNVSEFVISCNTEEDCGDVSYLAESRWNYAFWRQDETPIIYTYEENEGTEILFKWYMENGINDIGVENENSMYDKNFNYIGKGPIGYYELLTAVSNVARRFQEEGFIFKKFGYSIPIIVHDLEYPWYVQEATKNANPNGEANLFLKALQEGFPE